VVLGPDGLSRFDELRRRSAARAAILFAFDLIERNGEDLRDLAFLDRKAVLALLLRDTETGILLACCGRSGGRAVVVRQLVSVVDPSLGSPPPVRVRFGRD